MLISFHDKIFESSEILYVTTTSEVFMPIGSTTKTINYYLNMTFKNGSVLSWKCDELWKCDNLYNELVDILKQMKQLEK